MARAEANPTPDVLIWARESRGLSVEAAAKRLGVLPERLAAWERGREKPTFAQLRTLSTIYKRPFAVFYLAEPPRRFDVMHDFRRTAESARVPHSPELTLEIRKAYDRREWALDLFQQIEEEPPNINLAISLDQDAEAAAIAIRGSLRVSIEQQSAWRVDYEALRQWRRVIERAGILTFQAADVETSEARGFSIGNRPLPAAVTNLKDAPRGRIFTLLHEVVHILLRDGGICDLHDSQEDESSKVEAFCNRVAGATLFPRNDLLATRIVREHRRGSAIWTDDELTGLSRQFGGSREAALVRLLSLGLTNASYYHDKKDEFLKQYAEQRAQQGGFAPPHEVALTSAGPTFIGLVIESFNRERITASDVSDYLQIRLKHLPEVQREYAEFTM